MISKIFVTLAVIMICMWMLSSRAKPKLKEVLNPAVERRKILLHNASLGFMLIMVIAASVMIYLEVDKGNAVVTVHVINTQSGAKKSYRVMQNDIHNDGFTTLDGLQVFVAAIERIEIETR